MQPGMEYPLFVLPHARHSQEGEPMIGGVVRRPRSARKLKIDVDADDLTIPVDHFLEACRFERGVM